MMLSVISLYMIMILLSFVSVIRYVICSNNQNWLLKLNLIFETLWTRVGSGLLTSMLEKLISFDRSNITGAVDVKMDGSVLEEKSCFKMLRLTFSSKLDWGSYISSIAKTTSKQAGAPSYFLKLFDKLQKRICKTVGPSLPASLEPLAHRRNVASLSHFHFLFFILEGGLLVILTNCMISLSPFLDVTRMFMSTASFLAQRNSGIIRV